MMISLDTETTGLDLRHGAKPFLVTICRENGENVCWPWDVDPLTRQPDVPEEDLQEIQAEIDAADYLVLQNPKFDGAALQTVFGGNLRWDWSKIYDTLLAGHLLSSNTPHDLTNMCIQYLGTNLQRFEDGVKKATEECRRVARRDHPEWRIAKKGLPEMPSAKEKVWKFDMWLPKVFNPESTLCSEYANSDSAATLALFQVQETILKEKGLWPIYLERLKLLPIVYRVEKVGITLNGDRLGELTTDYREESTRVGRLCVNIAASYNYELELPKSGNNGSLLKFCFNRMELPVYKKSKKTGNPSLDKQTLEHYEATLPTKSKQLLFIKSLKSKRKRDTAINYMEGYEKFWLAIGKRWYRLHPSLNPTGTDTLRWSSSNPNEQNISKQGMFEGDKKNLRYCFGPAPGREWWSLDYDNLELRIPAYESGEPAMLELFNNPDKPPYYGSYHLMIFDILHPKEFVEHGVDVKNVYKSTLYQWTKNGNFADLYGAVESSGTADRAFHVDGGQRLVSERLTEKSKLNQKMIDYANEHGYVETIPDKEICPERGYPLICGRGYDGKIKPTIPLNYHVQGTACWIMMRAMIKVQEYLDTLDGYNMVMNVHDEIVFDFPYIQYQSNGPIITDIKRLMESVGDPVGVKLTVGVDYHPKNWSTAV